jgi:hypothetical protein
MFRIITDIQDPMLDFLRDDPVRPDIPREFRVAPNRFVAALVEDQPQAMVCVSLQRQVPETVDQLGDSLAQPTVAVFYTIWSYAPGAGRELLMQTVAQIKERFPTITRFVTLSPKTEMARKFHHKNGATTFRENSESVNYEYPNNK